ncbi:MFS transporter [Rhodococcus sp. Leaf7]|uniref:MFS transporter n=1 Tax=unclassified Rhodococcus (in: high G+C Gram-positive bacteria) TaxID=192944 RepID=UPI000701ABCA|nr:MULTISPECIES: MFS transporter [unclassified Rhodococcus (in: high G+C Gram-positive bacteria)]KQU07766.1 MFS transporter [Rhodococcus sp. Leaf7]KQU43283.1 MFS transporter [Rhodococcus sp. Leaf247]
MTTSPPTSLDEDVTGTGRIVGVLAFAGITVALMQTLIIPIVPQLPTLVNASAANTAWAITATLLAGAVAVPVTGRLGDMFGKRRLLLVSLALLVAGSVVGALATSLIPLIIGRALQGLAAGVIPLGISIMRDVLPSRKLPGSIALMSASLGVGGALGLPAAAVIAEYASWHFLFWTAAALGLIVTALVVAVIPESDARTGGAFDFGGAATLSVALVTLLLGISKGSDWGWTSARTLGLLVVAVVAFAAWVTWELRSPQPLVDLRVSMRRQVLFTNAASIMLGFAMFALSLVLPQILQLPAATGVGLGKSVLVAGLVMAPSGLVMMAVAPLSSRITTTRGPKTTLMAGAGVVAVGYLAGIVLMGAVWQLVVVSLIIGTGIGLAYGAMPALIMSAVPATETAAANSFNTLMRSLGTSFASAVAGVILASMTVTLGSAQVPTQNAFRVVMAVAAGAAVLSVLLASFLPAHGRTDDAVSDVVGGPVDVHGVRPVQPVD